MGAAPESIDGAKVILISPVDERHRPTGGCRQIVAGIFQGPVNGLAICGCDGEEGFYLFGCDASWCVVTDTWHQTVEEAKGQAEFEYQGVSATWLRPN